MITVSNEVLEAVNFELYLKKHEFKQHEDKLLHVSNYQAEALERIRLGVKQFGDPMPWQKTQDYIRFRPGEVTMWAGPNGSGKSLVLNMCSLTLAQISAVGIASFEMPPASTVERLIKQGTGNDNPTDQIVNKLMHALNLYIYNHVGTLKTDVVFGMCHYMAKEKGIKHIIIDSLVKCGVDSGENEPQKKFMSKLQDIAKEHNIHIHLVHHIKKLQNETDTPDKYSVKGAGELVDLTDNLILVYKNKIKEKKIKENREVDNSDPDCFLDVSKQRHGEFEGRFSFWLHKENLQWVDNPNNKYLRFV